VRAIAELHRLTNTQTKYQKPDCSVRKTSITPLSFSARQSVGSTHDKGIGAQPMQLNRTRLYAHKPHRKLA